MAWTADGSALTDHTSFVRVINEGASSKRNSNASFPYQHGEHSHFDKFYTAADILLEVRLLDDDAFTHLSELHRMFGKTTGHVTLSRTDRTTQGTVSADVELLSDPRASQDRFTYVFPLRNPGGFWEGPVITTAAGTAPSITITGDRPVDDMVVTFAAPGSAVYANAAYGTSTLVWGGTGTAIVDVGARTITKGGSFVDADFTVSQPWWLRFAEGETVNLTSTANITVDYRNKWA